MTPPFKIRTRLGGTACSAAAAAVLAAVAQAAAALALVLGARVGDGPVPGKCRAAIRAARLAGRLGPCRGGAASRRKADLDGRDNLGFPALCWYKTPTGVAHLPVPGRNLARPAKGANCVEMIVIIKKF